MPTIASTASGVIEMTERSSMAMKGGWYPRPVADLGGSTDEDGAKGESLALLGCEGRKPRSARLRRAKASLCSAAKGESLALLGCEGRKPRSARLRRGESGPGG